MEFHDLATVSAQRFMLWNIGLQHDDIKRCRLLRAGSNEKLGHRLGALRRPSIPSHRKGNLCEWISSCRSWLLSHARCFSHLHVSVPFLLVHHFATQMQEEHSQDISDAVWTWQPTRMLIH